MPYIPQTEKEREQVLRSIGISSFEELLAPIPSESRVKGPLDLPKGVSEQELITLAKGLASKNASVSEYSSFLGAGAYNHYIPSAVQRLAFRSEFYTAYTPYQPEISQGTLQAVFEYQTLVCQLTGMDVSNASLYDGASAVAEAVLMAKRITGREDVYLSSALHPEYREVVKTYLRSTGDSVHEIMYCAETGRTLVEAVEKGIKKDPACLVVQHPNFFGSLEEAKALADFIHSKKGIFILVITEPVSLGILKPPAELGCDIVVGENQSFGNALNYGGPYLGFMATKSEYIRQMPGRLIGETVDRDGKKAFCLTFSTREQHIRRERATSNICTNHGLCALMASIYLTSLGLDGIKKLAKLNFSKAGYLRQRLEEKGIKKAFNAASFNEFTIKVENSEEALKKLLKKKIIGGLDLKRFYPELGSHILVAATEMNSKEELDALVENLSGV